MLHAKVLLLQYCFETKVNGSMLKPLPNTSFEEKKENASAKSKYHTRLIVFVSSL